MVINALGTTSAQRRWTQAAKDCHARGGVCQDCFYNTFFKGSSNKCHMKATVLELVRVYGAPNLTEEVLEDEE